MIIGLELEYFYCKPHHLENFYFNFRYYLKSPTSNGASRNGQQNTEANQHFEINSISGRITIKKVPLRKRK